MVKGNKYTVRNQEERILDKLNMMRRVGKRGRNIIGKGVSGERLKRERYRQESKDEQ